MKFYAVKNGRQCGIFTSYSECEKQVKGYSGSLFKSFNSQEEATSYLKEDSYNSSYDLYAYVDGSFNSQEKIYGYGVIILQNEKIITQIYGQGNHKDYLSMRNVAGEIAGAMEAVNYALKINAQSLLIYYDYQGIESWAKELWKANKLGTKHYQEFMKEAMKKMSIDFQKVKAHTGEYYNEMADKLARKACHL